jgi:hypothetical protein
MLLRNVHIDGGLCNGTCMIITGIHQRLLEVCKAAVNGSAVDSHVHLIPRIDLMTRLGRFPFVLHHQQFPIWPCFAMTINKSQGQSLHTVSVNLQSSAFSHGQLYVALSHCTDINKLMVCLLPGRSDTRNVVYLEVLQLFCD